MADIVHIQELMHEAGLAARSSADAMVQFHAAIKRNDFEFAEDERNKIIWSTEAYLDRLMPVAKLTQDMV